MSGDEKYFSGRFNSSFAFSDWIEQNLNILFLSRSIIKFTDALQKLQTPSKKIIL